VKRIVLLAALLAVSCSKEQPPEKPARQEAKKGPVNVRVMNPWARETAPGQTMGAAYMTIRNPSWDTDWLQGVTVDAPATAAVHDTATANGVTSMKPVASLEIPAGGAVQLKPQGTHIMISGLAAPLKERSSLALTLHFKRSGDRKIDVPVLDAAADGPK
jgi:periplasmic copper chaperone A